MTADIATAGETLPTRQPLSLEPALRGLGRAAVAYASESAQHKVENLTRRVEAIAAPRGALERAAFEGAKAWLLKRNPVWAAMKGAWLGASTAAKVGFVALVVLLLVLAPVVLVLLLLALLIIAVVAAVRAATRS